MWSVREVCIQPKAIASPTHTSKRLQNKAFGNFEKFRFSSPSEFLFDFFKPVSGE